MIDNANELKDLEANYGALRSCANFHLLLTTRIIEFEQAPTHRIEPLEKKAAVGLFKEYYARHKAEENDLLEGILAAVGCNTLVIELLAKSLASSNKLKTRYSLAQLLQDLQKKGLLAFRHTKPVSTGYQATGIRLREERPEAIIEAMYDLSGLTKEETAMLSVFAVLPAENIPFEILETLVPGEDLEGPLLLLAQKGWLDYNEDAKSFKVSPVVQEIIKKKTPQLLEDCRGLLNNLVEKLEYQPGTGHFLNCSYEDAAVFARYAESLISSVLRADEDIPILCERVGRYFQTTGNLEQALTYYEDYNRLERELYEAHPQNVSFKNGLAISFTKLASIQERKSNKESARSYYKMAEKHWIKLVTKFPAYAEFKKNLQWVQNKLAEIDDL